MNQVNETEFRNQQINISMFSKVNSNKAIPYCTNFDALAEVCSIPDEREEKDGRAFCPTSFEPLVRKMANAKECSFLAFDLDSLPEDVTADDVIAKIPGIRAFCYSTFSHKLEGKGSRFRVIIVSAR